MQPRTTRTLPFHLGGAEIDIGMDVAGSGPGVVLLPALSSISTRAEMYPLLDRLESRFRVSTTDWPGFGNLARTRADWSPNILSEFLEWYLREFASPPIAVVAAGHAATYALHHSVHYPGTIARLALIAPTWRGPLPTMLGARRAWFARVSALVDRRGIGPWLYRLNVSRVVVAAMARGHVYSDPAWFGGERMAAKLAVTRAPGARHASIRFVSGLLDRVDSRGNFLELARRAAVSIQMIYGEHTPPKSRAEMEALAALPNVSATRLPMGKLSVHEEFPDAVASVLIPFLDAQ